MAGHILICLLVLAVRAGAQNTTFKKPEIYSLSIYSDIKYRFATTRVTSRVKNPGTASREAIFDVTLPNEAFITNLTLDIDGKIVVGEIKKKAEAKAQYVAAQQRGESAGYIETKHRETNRFNLAITAAPLGKVTFNLTYQELLQRKHGHYEQVIYIYPGQPVPEMDITVSIVESRKLTYVKVPPLRNDVGAELMDLETIAVIQNLTPKSALVTCVPSVEQQTDSGMAGQFVVQYDVERDMDAGDIMVVNGYFVHFFAPEGLDAIPNDVLFILDTSGSMAGTKLSQLKRAMMSILKVLNEGDRFNILTFSSTTRFWKQAMLDIADEDGMEAAKSFVNSLIATGGTNINQALIDGIKFLKGLQGEDPNIRSPVIVFLTDGQATSGITNSMSILSNIESNNRGTDIPIFSLAFGAHADFDLVKKIAIQNNGFGRKIYEASDAAMQISGLYNEISLTLLKNLTFNYLDAPVSNLTDHHFENYFNGSEVIVAGKVNNYDPAHNKVDLEITTNSINGPRVFILTDQFESEFQEVENLTKLGDYEKITEKVWAYLTIKQLIEKELVTSDKKEKLAYNKKILDLSMQYSFVSPLTAMVVTQDEKNKTNARPITSIAEDIVDTAPSVVGKAIGSSATQVISSRGRPVPQIGGIQNMPIQTARRRPPHSTSYHASIPLSASGGHGFVPQNSPGLGRADRTNRPQQGKSRKKNRSRVKHRRPAIVKHRQRRPKATYTAPLMVEVQGVSIPLCFQLSPSKSSNGTEYLLYENTGVKIQAKITEKPYRKGKMQTVVTSVDFIGSNSTIRATSQNATHILLDQIANKDYSFDAGDFRLVIKSIGKDSLGMFVDTIDPANLADSGILGSILSKKIKIKSRKGHATPKRRKESAVFKVDKTKVKAIMLRKQPAYGKGTGESTCWLMRKENLFYDIKQHTA